MGTWKLVLHTHIKKRRQLFINLANFYDLGPGWKYLTAVEYKAVLLSWTVCDLCTHAMH